MAEPLPPEGYIRLKDAYDAFVYGRLGEPPPMEGGYQAVHSDFSAKVDSANREFVDKLPSLAYGGKVVSIEGKLHEISGNMFDRTAFADLLPLHNAIPVGISGPLANYSGGIICLNGSAFFNWLQQDLSIHLHGEIQEGQLTPIEADERLRNLNLSELHPAPSSKEFHSVLQGHVFWTLSMAVAWIAWRDLDCVVRCIEPYRKYVGHWRESKGPNQTKSGFVWECASPQNTLLGLMLEEAIEKIDNYFPVLTIKQSREDLWNKLQLGIVKATGVQGFNQRQPIEPHSWQDLEIGGDGERREYLHRQHIPNESERWNKVTVSRDDILREWPLEPSLSQNQETKPDEVARHGDILRPLAEADLKSSFERYRMQQNANLTRDGIENWGREKFGSRVTTVRLRQLYNNSKPHGGHRRGRKLAS